MWQGLFLLLIVIVVVWWLLTRNVNQSQDETPVAHELLTEEHNHSGAEQALATTVEQVTARNNEDDLIIIEGIGPKIKSILNNAGIKTFNQLAASDPADLRKLLLEAGLSIGDPTSWPEQARLADLGDIEKLQQYQATLKGGRIE